MVGASFCPLWAADCSDDPWLPLSPPPPLDGGWLLSFLFEALVFVITGKVVVYGQLLSSTITTLGGLVCGKVMFGYMVFYGFMMDWFRFLLAIVNITIVILFVLFYVVVMALFVKVIVIFVRGSIVVVSCFSVRQTRLAGKSPVPPTGDSMAPSFATTGTTTTGSAASLSCWTSSAVSWGSSMPKSTPTSTSSSIGSCAVGSWSMVPTPGI